MDMSPDSEFEDTKGNKVSSCIRSFTETLRVNVFNVADPDPHILQYSPCIVLIRPLN